MTFTENEHPRAPVGTFTEKAQSAPESSVAAAIAADNTWTMPDLPATSVELAIAGAADLDRRGRILLEEAEEYFGKGRIAGYQLASNGDIVDSIRITLVTGSTYVLLDRAAARHAILADLDTHRAADVDADLLSEVTGLPESTFSSIQDRLEQRSQPVILAILEETGTLDALADALTNSDVYLFDWFAQNGNASFLDEARTRFVYPD